MKKLLQLFLAISLPIIAHAQVVNSQCSGAITLPVNSGALCEQSVYGSFEGALFYSEIIPCMTYVTPDPTPTEFRDLWYEFTATSKRHYLNVSFPNSEQSDYYFSFLVFDDNCNQTDVLACGNKYMGSIDDLTIGETYKIRLILHIWETGPTPSFNLCMLSLPLIEVNSGQYTTEQLITDVLVNSSCLSVSNITSTTGTGADENGIGYFTKGQSQFPFDEGIILSSGRAIDAGYLPLKYDFDEQSNGWPGDEDLTDIMLQYDSDFESFNATSIEFDFIPQIDYLSFDFIFASNEYGTYQCAYSDAFAFLLTDTTTNETTNLAVVSGTSTPISVITVRDNAFNSLCPSVNPEFFGDYNLIQASIETSPIPNILSSIGFKGNTVPMKAQSIVQAGHQYHIKLVISDRKDALFASAVFINAGSFNIGSADSGYVKISSSNGNILCDGSSTTLSVNLNDTFAFSWAKDGSPISGADANSLTVNESGSYTVTVGLPNAPECALEFNTNIFLSEESSAGDVIIDDHIIFETNSDGTYEFDLTAATEQVLTQTEGDEFIVSYHLSQADAEANINPLPIIFTNTSNPQTIYARVGSSISTCFTTTSFLVVVLDETYTTPAPTGASDQTFTEGDTLADIELDGENIQWYDNSGEGPVFPDGSSLPLPLTTLLTDGTTYYASQTIYGIESTQRLAVTAHLILGTDSAIFNGLNYYPNPTTGILYIENASNIDTASITNALGQKIITKAINSNSTQVDISSLSNGIYFVTVTSGNAAKIIKIIKE